MIIDASEFEFGTNVETDLCIIGAGVAGITIAREFNRSETNLLILESGGMQPPHDSEALNHTTHPSYSDYKIDITRASAFGGSSHLWKIPVSDDELGVRLRRLDAIDFEKKSWVPYSGWPFSKTHLDPFYIRAHNLFKIGPYSYEIQDWRGSGHIDYFNFNEDDLKSTIFQFAKKDLFFNDYRKEIENSDNITAFLNATVLNIDLSDNARIVASLTVETSGGKRFSVKAKKFILAAGGLENARLLLLSNDKVKCGIGNQHDLVGRFFMEHPHFWENVATFHPSDPEAFNSSNINGSYRQNGIPVERYLTISDDLLEKHQLLNLVVGIRGKTSPTYPRAQEAIDFVKKPQSKNEYLHKELLRKSIIILQNIDVIGYSVLQRYLGGNIEKWDRYPYEYSGLQLNIMSEQQPNPNSRITLDEKNDTFGLNKIKLDWRLQNYDIKSIRESLDIIDKILRNNNFGFLKINIDDDYPLHKIRGGYHHMGTTRMHTDPKHGVIDEHCRVHGVENFYIAGSSVFPTSGCANPTLTIAALSLKLADFLKNQRIV